METSLVVKGGLLQQQKYPDGIGVKVESFEVRGVCMDFVALEKSKFWFLKVAGGEAALRGHFKNTKILDIIYEACLESVPDQADDRQTTPKKNLRSRGGRGGRSHVQAQASHNHANKKKENAGWITRQIQI